ncbi:MAG TPA: type II toxin-antitoxin system PrlF family antitoxin [Terriglobales bacterium]|nr:type II toxin-antitoxin system PrlF family antitoxin [Terriglobales bacterium]
MPFRSRITSKGQVTVPVEIRRKLGLKHGDKVEFREHAGETIIVRAAESGNPFDKYAGILARKIKRPFDSRKWQADLRKEE